jgi:hypothetical protein
MGSAINCEVSSSFSSSFSNTKTACKDSPNGSLSPGPIDFEITGEALLELDGSGTGFQDLAAWHLSKTSASCNYICSSPGGFTISCPETYLTALSTSGSTEEDARFTFTITGSGDWSI